MNADQIVRVAVDMNSITGAVSGILEKIEFPSTKGRQDGT